MTPHVSYTKKLIKNGGAHEDPPCHSHPSSSSPLPPSPLSSSVSPLLSLGAMGRLRRLAAGGRGGGIGECWQATVRRGGRSITGPTSLRTTTTTEPAGERAQRGTSSGVWVVERRQRQRMLRSSVVASRKPTSLPRPTRSPVTTTAFLRRRPHLAPPAGLPSPPPLSYGTTPPPSSTSPSLSIPLSLARSLLAGCRLRHIHHHRLSPHPLPPPVVLSSLRAGAPSCGAWEHQIRPPGACVPPIWWRQPQQGEGPRRQPRRGDGPQRRPQPGGGPRR